jgi:hypothetical protein
MTNKPTIDGVSTDLIRMTIDLLQDLRRGTAVERKLRALLDAPAVERHESAPKEWSCSREAGCACNKWNMPHCFHGKKAEPVAAEVSFGFDDRSVKVSQEAYSIFLARESALQSTIAQLQARLQELESGRGEADAWALLNGGGLIRDLTDRWDVAKHWDGIVESLYFAPPAPVALVLPDRDLLRDKIAEAIGGDTYDCTRVWSAWGFGTMDQDDFVPLVEQEERLYEIVDACLDATAALNGPAK